MPNDALAPLVDPYTQALFGVHARRVPIQLAVQQAGEHTVSAILISRSDLTFGSKLTHQLILGDAIIRPHVVLESDAFKGHGLSGLAMTPLDDWVEQGQILINPAGRKL
jgi:hypothetical protein